MSCIQPGDHRVSVVIPTWNGGPRFQKLLDALAAQDFAEGVELVCVDSGSKDGTPDMATAAGGKVHAIPQSEFNHGGTRNLGISLASGEIVLLLTQDAVPMGTGYVQALVEAYDDPVIDGAYARQFPLPEQDPILKDRLASWSASRDEPVTQVLGQGDPAAALEAFNALEPLQRLMTCAFDNVASSVRRSSWERHPFPEAPFGEDVAWGKEVLLAGGAIRFCPDAMVEHSHPLSVKREFKRLYCDHRNLYHLFGLRNVDSWKRVFDGWKWQRGVYEKLLDEDSSLTEAERKHWKKIGNRYALFECMGQFLGARSWWKTEQSWFWRKFDKQIRKGV